MAGRVRRQEGDRLFDVRLRLRPKACLRLGVGLRSQTSAISTYSPQVMMQSRG